MDSSIHTKSKIDQLLWYKYFMQLHNCGHASVGSANIRCTWLMCLLLLSTKKSPYHTKIPLPFKEYDHIWFPCSKRPREPLTKRFCWMNLFSHFGILEETKRPLISQTLSALGIEIRTDSVFFSFIFILGQWIMREKVFAFVSKLFSVCSLEKKARRPLKWLLNR